MCQAVLLKPARVVAPSPTLLPVITFKTAARRNETHTMREGINRQTQQNRKPNNNIRKFGREAKWARHYIHNEPSRSNNRRGGTRREGILDIRVSAVTINQLIWYIPCYSFLFFMPLAAFCRCRRIRIDRPRSMLPRNFSFSFSSFAIISPRLWRWVQPCVLFSCVSLFVFYFHISSSFEVVINSLTPFTPPPCTTSLLFLSSLPMSESQLRFQMAVGCSLLAPPWLQQL